MAQHRTQNQVFCHFLKFASLVFLEIAYNDRLQQCLTSSRGRIHEKFWAPKLGHNWAQDQVFFCHFLKLGSLAYLQIAYRDSWQQCITSIRGKTHEKKFLGPKRSKNRPKICFFTFSQVQYISFSLNCIGWQLGTLSKTTSRGKTNEKFHVTQIGSRIRFFTIFSRLDHCTRWQLGTMSNIQQSSNFQKNFVAQIGAEMIFVILMLSNFHLLVYGNLCLCLCCLCVFSSDELF